GIRVKYKQQDDIPAHSARRRFQKRKQNSGFNIMGLDKRFGFDTPPNTTRNTTLSRSGKNLLSRPPQTPFQIPLDQLEEPIDRKRVRLLQPGLKVSGNLGNFVIPRLDKRLPQQCGPGFLVSRRKADTDGPSRGVFLKRNLPEKTNRLWVNGTTLEQGGG